MGTIFNVVMVCAVAGLVFCSIIVLIIIAVAAFTEPPNMDIVACEKCGDLYYGKDVEKGRCIKCS